MATTDKRVDAYIARSADFARPILTHLRKLVHRSCPDAVETIKWGFPHFDYKGMLCSMASFKAHCTFGFWKAGLLDDRSGALSASGSAMGHLGRITRPEDLPADAVLSSLIRQAARLNDEGVKLPRKAPPRPARKPVPPAWFTAALRSSPKAAGTFNDLPPSRRREYVEWVTGGKREDTRRKRLSTTLMWLRQGKSMNWKYERRRGQKKP